MLSEPQLSLALGLLRPGVSDLGLRPSCAHICGGGVPVRQRLEPCARRTGRTTKQVVEELQRTFGDLSVLPPAMVPEVCAWLDREGE